MSQVICHVLHVIYHMSCATCHNFICYFFFFGQSGEAYRSRVCYQRGSTPSSSYKNSPDNCEKLHLCLIHAHLLHEKSDMHIGLYMQGWRSRPVERASQVVTCPIPQATSHSIRIRFRICQKLLLSNYKCGFPTNYLKKGNAKILH